MNQPGPRSNAHANQRRSQRMLLTVPVILVGKRANDAAFVERTSTLVVNAHGALIRLKEQVIAGQNLRMKNVATGDEIDCTVIDINSGDSGISEVGVEFAKPSPGFWRVSFPPEDWTPRSPEAKRYTGEHHGGRPVLVKK